jgi:hypothetical protein
MKHTAAVNQTAKPIDENTDLGFGLLIAEAEGSGYEPVTMVSTIRDAGQIVEQDLRNRMSELERGGEPMCPARYAVWKQGERGNYRIVSTIETN